MKYTTIIKAVISAVSIFIASCANYKEAVVPLAQLGLAVAESKGVINEGDVVLIRKLDAVIKSEGTAKDKILPLATIGLDAAVSSGKLSEGDKLLITHGAAILIDATAKTSSK